MTDYYDHIHGYVRVRRVHPLLKLLAVRLGLERFLIESGEEPHHPECTPTTAVLRSRGRVKP